MYLCSKFAFIRYNNCTFSVLYFLGSRPVILFLMSSHKAAICFTVSAPACHHVIKLLIVDAAISVNIRLLWENAIQIPLFSEYLTSTRESHSTSDILSPKFIITCLSSTRLMNPLPSYKQGFKSCVRL